jgi:thioesterase domain-containing protein
MNPQRDPRRAWGRLGNAVEYIEVDGDHHTMLHDPAVKVLANNLRAYISRAKAPTGAGKISS